MALLVALLVPIAAILLLMISMQTQLLFPTNAVAPAGPLPQGAAQMQIGTSDGETLRGIYLPPAVEGGGPRTLVVGFGGNAWNAQDAAEYLHATFPEAHVVAFHYRGYSPSTGSPSARALIADAPVIFDEAVKRVAPQKVLAVGFSIGSGVAASLADRVDGLILVTPFDSLKAVAGDLYPWLPVGPFFEHGTHKPQKIERGTNVLFDCGCSVHGYQSDISRSFVWDADATPEQLKVWNQVARGQQVANAAAKIGAPAGSVDDAVRNAYESWGYGPGYKLPGLSHRTGHGIGMEGHEPVNLVHGEKTPLAAGMCFSNEPGIYLPGKFGIRLEDCFHMTASGPKWFSVPPKSLDEPMGHSGA